MLINQERGLQTSNIRLASIATSIACSSTICILLIALNKLDVDNNGVVASASTFAGVVASGITNVYKNA